MNVEHPEPGTEVTVVWSEEGTRNPRVEPYAGQEVRATVATAPYVRDSEDL